MSSLGPQLEIVFLEKVVEHLPDSSSALKFVFVNKKCCSAVHFQHENAFYLRTTARDCNSCVKFLREFKLFPGIKTLVINSSYFRTFKTHPFLNQIQSLKLYDLNYKNFNFVAGCEDKIIEIGMIVDSDQKQPTENLDFSKFPLLKRVILNMKILFPLSTLFPNKTQHFDMVKIVTPLQTNFVEFFKEFKNIEKIVVVSNTQPSVFADNVYNLYDGFVSDFPRNYFCKSVKFTLQRNEGGCDVSQFYKIMDAYYPSEILLDMTDKFDVDWKYDLDELRGFKTYEDYFHKRHEGDHDCEYCFAEGYSVSEEFINEKSNQNTDAFLALDDNVFGNEKTNQRRSAKKKLAERKRMLFDKIVNDTEIDLTKYTQLQNIEVKSPVINVKKPENYCERRRVLASGQSVSKRDEQKVYTSIRRNLDMTKEIFTNAKMIKCKLLQKTIFPITLKRLTLEDCEIVSYKSGTCFQLPKSVTCLTLKGNVDQHALHIERSPLIELQLLETPFVEINPFPQTLTKIKLMNVNSSRLMNFSNCILTSLELVACQKAGFVLPNLRLFRADVSNVYIKNIESVKVRRAELFRCFINEQEKLVCDHLFCFGDICDKHNNPFFESCFEELPISPNRSVSSPTYNSMIVNNSVEKRGVPANPFSRSAESMDVVPLQFVGRGAAQSDGIVSPFRPGMIENYQQFGEINNQRDIKREKWSGKQMLLD
ncbi:hypothetical protein EIN_376560 [Entamoeba invadens IP1]|uniref:Uncharacterized protein n=1 Tax=Entamoeba invadens IP1 TaxID=370355 RepID=A0A0A1TYA4_ENTIV|nr:hypothetical protein EIN_376560 [Entamoeba invadens IP1]ELP83481.1 hypothetical protein EIN_376560 [Entamoeba invadens IP1]|eukprot:XP_004182827.1 hypothetical protein EIN_376560 [Entamoeba invadens IP1]